MSMYKTIFVNTDWENVSAGAQVANINGEVLLFGETAFSSVEEAVAAVGNNGAVVISVASGKYDAFGIVNTAGEYQLADKVVAVDFDGGTMMTADGEVTVANSGFSAEAQLSIINELNANNAANGTIFVADSKGADTTILVGMGEANYVAGQDAAAVYGADAEEVFSVINVNENVSTLAASQVSVSSSYNSSTEGWGTTTFNSWNSAYSATTSSSTITIEANSGNAGYIGDSNNSNRVGRNVVVNSGSSLSIQRRLLKIDKTLTFKAGSSFIDNHLASVPTPYTHIDGGKLYVGEANSTEKATMNFKDNSVATLWSATFEAHNADISLGDFASVGKSSFNDSEITVNGSVSFGAHNKQTGDVSLMKNATMTVKGHDMRNDDTYFANDFNRIANLVMDNSSITIDDGVEGTVADTVELGFYNGSGLVKYKKPLTLTNGSSITVEKGTVVNANYDVTLSDSTINAGNLNIVDGAFNMQGKSELTLTSLNVAEGKTLTIDSSSSIEAQSLTLTGKITINPVDGFDPSKPIIDITGANGLTDDILSKITVADGYSAYVKDGDLYFMKGVIVDATEDADGNKTLDLSADGAVGSNKIDAGDKNVTLTTGDQENTDVTDTAEIKSDVSGNNITLENSKNLAVTGSIEASDSVKITNAGSDAAGNEATLNGGAAGTNAKITATETITMQNDGHAEVELKAKNIVIANNSTNTLIGNIGTADTASIVIGTGKITENGIDTDGYGDVDGSIKGATITATEISIDNQQVENTTVTGSYVSIDNIVFKGDNTLSASTQFVTGGSTLTVDKGGSLKTEGTRFTVGYGSNLTANGSIEDGKAVDLTAEELAAMKKTLDLNGLSLAGSSAGTVTVNDAYVNLGNVSSAKNSTGTFNFNFNNSYVTTSNRWVVTNSKDTIQALNITLDGSVFAPAMGFTQQSANGSLTLNNGSKMIAGVMRNYGTITINSGSSLELTGYFQQSSHGSQYGDIIVNDGDLIVNGGQAFDLRSGASLTVNNGGSVTANQGLEVLEGAVFTIDADANLVASKLIGAGTITITNEAAGWTGYNKVIDLSGTESLEGKINIENLAEGVRVIYGDDGDVTLTDADMSKFYVNTAYAGKKFGEKVGEKLYFGVNAFDNYETALNDAPDGMEIDVVGSNPYTFYIGKSDSDTDVTVNFTGDVKALWKNMVRVDAGSTGNVINGSTLEYAGFGVRGTLNVGSEDGETGIATGKYFNIYGENGYPAAEVNVYAGSTLTVDDGSQNQSFVGHGSDANRKGVLNVLGGTVEAKYLKVNAGTGEINVDDGTLSVSGTLTNSGTVNVTGDATLNIKNVTGDGWISMNGVTLDSDTSIKNGKVQFASGINNIDNAVIEGRTFQVGMAKNSGLEYDTDTGVTVNVNNNSVIGAGGTTYDGWVGSEYGTASDKEGVEYTLNINNSQAHFGYLHISSDGNLNVTGHTSAENKFTQDGRSTDFYAGDLITNGVTTIDGADVRVKYTKVSVDTDENSGPGKLVIKNGANYYAVIGNGSNTGRTFHIWKDGIVEVNDATLKTTNTTLIETEKGKLNILNGATYIADGVVTNNGTVTIEDSTATINNLANSGKVVIDSSDVKGKITGAAGSELRFLGDNTIDADLTIDTTDRIYVGSLGTSDSDAVVGTMDKTNLTVTGTTVNAGSVWVGAQYADGITNNMTSTLNIGDGAIVNINDHSDTTGGNSSLVVRESGIVNITGGSKVNISGDLDTVIQGAVTVDGDGSEINFAPVGPTKIYKDNAILTVSNGAVANFGSYPTENIYIGDSRGYKGQMVLDNGTANFGSAFTVYANGILSMSNGSKLTAKGEPGHVNDNGPFDVVNKGTITVTDSTFTAYGVDNSGYFNLSVTSDLFNSLTGSFTLLDQTGDAGMDVTKLTVNVAGTNREVGESWEVGGVQYTLSTGTGNDVILAVKPKEFIVDASFNEETPGYGFSKFKTFREAVTAANANGGGVINLTDEAYVYADALPDSDANNLWVTNPGSYTITGGNGLLVNYELEINPDRQDKVEGDYVVNFDNASVTMSKLTLRDSVTATITDSVMNFKGYLGNGTISGPSYLSVYRDSTLEINNSTVGLDITRGDGKFDDPADDVAGDGIYNNFGATWNIFGSLSVTDSTIYAGPGWGSDSFQIRKGASAALTGSTAHVIHLDVGYSNADEKKLNADRTSDNASLVLDNTKVYNTMYAGDQPSLLTGLLVGSSGTTNADSVVIKNNSVVDMTVNTGVYDNRDKGLYVGNKNSSVSVESGSQLIVSKAENNGTVNVSGESTLSVAGKVTGNGWVYMDGVSLDENTRLDGANVRFASGENVVDGATIDNGRFQVGTGTWQAPDSRVDTENGVTVTVKNNAHIGGIDTSESGAPYGGWVGSEFYDKQADKDAAMTGAKYTLNIENSIANFGYMHVSHDGIMNVSGNADAKESYTGVDYSFYAGFFNVNGVATFDNVDALVINTNVSCDNGTDNPGKLIIKNGTNYVSYWDHSGTNETFKISKNGIVEVDNATLDVRHSTWINSDASLTVKNGAKFLGNRYGTVTNNGTITADASSTFSAVSIVNNGTFNGAEAGDMVVLGDMTVTGNLQTSNLTVAAGAALTAGTITVTNLTVDINSELTFGTGSTIGNDFITVTGKLQPENAEFTLVAKGWDFADKLVYFDANYDGTITSDEHFTVGTKGAENILFHVQDGNLYIKKEDADVTGVYIGEFIFGTGGNVVDAAGNKVASEEDMESQPNAKFYIVTDGGVKYEIGKDAFATVDDAADKVDAEAITEITIGKGDHIDAVADNFTNVENIKVTTYAKIENEEASFSGNLNIDNDGHLDAKISVDGNLTMTNTSHDTLLNEIDVTGDYSLVNSGAAGGAVADPADYALGISAENVTIENQVSGIMKNVLLSADYSVDLSGEGTWDNVDVKALDLYLNGMDFTLDAGTDVLNVYLGNDLGFNGNNELVQAVIPGGTLTLESGVKVGTINGVKDDINNTATGQVKFDGAKLEDVSIENVDKVLLASGEHSFAGSNHAEYYMNNLEIGNASLNWGYSDADNLLYNIGPVVSVDEERVKVSSTADTATLNFTQTGEYGMDNFDVTGFSKTVNVGANSTITLNDAAEYFGNGANINVDGTVNLNLEAKETGVTFAKAGDIKVNASQTFTADKALNEFSGDLTVATDKTLTLDKANDTAAILYGAGDVVAKGNLELDAAGAINDFTGDIEASGAAVTVKLNGVNDTTATFSGNGKLDIAADQKFNADGAVKDLAGTLNVNGGNTLTLTGTNTTSAAVTGSGDIVADNNQTFYGDVSAFEGSYTANDDNTVEFNGTFADEMELNGTGKFNFAEKDAEITINSDDKATDLCITDNDVTLDSGTFGEITGITGSEVTVNNAITAASATVDKLIINEGKSLTVGTVKVTDLLINLNNTNTTWDGPAITVTSQVVPVDSFGTITVNSTSAEFKTPFTIVDGLTGQHYESDVVFLLNSNQPGVELTIDGIAVKVGDKFVMVYTEEGDLKIANYQAASSVVYVNSTWSDKDGEQFTWQGIGGENDTLRIVGRDAAASLTKAISMVEADDNGKGVIYIVKGNTYTSGSGAFMTTGVNGNEVTDMVINGDKVDPSKDEVRVGQAVIGNGVVALDRIASASLTLNNVSVSGNVIGGAEVKSNGGNGDEVNNLTLNGGYFLSSQITGGYDVTAGTVTLGTTNLTLMNDTEDEMIVLGRIIGGSVAGKDASVTQESANVTIDLSGEKSIALRGDIYAAGSNVRGGTMTVNNASVTFIGDAKNLSFTGRVSGGIYGEKVGEDNNTESKLVFSDFKSSEANAFRALIQDFDVITVSGETELYTSRKQTLCADTTVNFDIAGKNNANAMYTLNSFGWTAGTTISIDEVDWKSGEYTLISGAGVDKIEEVKIGGVTVDFDAIHTDTDGDRYTVTKDGDSIKLAYTNTDNMIALNVDDILDGDADTLNITGIEALAKDFAGAKAIASNFSATNLKINNIDGLLNGATQIAGADTTADTSDDVWAVLNQDSGNLTVAWGRSETEAKAALDAFQDQNSTFNLGTTMVAVDDSLLDGFDGDEKLAKKNNGTLA